MSRYPAVVSAERTRRTQPVRGMETPVAEAPNPTFGLAYWQLGLLAALPLLLAGIVLLADDLPRAPLAGINVGWLLAGLLVMLALAVAGAHRLGYPAWTQPLVTALPLLGVFLPVVTLHGQIIARVNGDPDRIVAVPLLVTWLLLVAATVICFVVAMLAGQTAPSYSGVGLLPLPLLLAWSLVLTPAFREDRVEPAFGSALLLAALAAFIAWLAPPARRSLVPLATIGLQFVAFLALRLHWPAFGGAIVLVIVLDVVLFAGLVVLIGSAPFCAAWLRQVGWPEVIRWFQE